MKTLEQTALDLLSRREHSATELARKLAQKGFEADEIASVIEILQAKNALSDARYAEARARSRAMHSKWGPTRIRQELAAQGVDPETAAATLKELEEETNWLQTATTLLQRKFSLTNNQLPLTNHQKALAFLLRKGFTVDQAQKALKNLQNQG